MKFDLLDSGKVTFISHILLHSIDHATEITKTEQWKEKRETVAKITVNEVEIPFELVESYFVDLYEHLQKQAEEKYADLDKEVHRRLEKRMEDEVQPIIDKLYELNNVLNSPGDLLKPYWERNNVD